MSDSQTLTLRPPVWALLLAVVLGGAFYLNGKWIEAKDHTPTTISVTGEGKVSAAPDIAELTFGVQTGRKATAKNAMALLTKDMDAVMKAVKAQGIAEKDISSDQFSLSPSYDWTSGRQVLQGYEASQTLRVKVRDLDKVSAVLTAATDAGANQAGDVQFTVDNPEKARAEAREKAITQAKEKARVLASDLGMKLGTLKGFGEGGNTPVPMYYSRNSMKMDSAAGVSEAALPMPAGEQDITSSVTLTYELN